MSIFSLITLFKLQLTLLPYKKSLLLMIYEKLIHFLFLLFTLSIFQASSHSVKNSLFLNEDLETGYIPKDQNGSYFYWLFRSHHKLCSAPLIVYLTGGPGCTSETAIFTGNGPYRVNKDNSTLRRNPYAWNQNLNLLYVDQPFGTGFSNSETFDQNLEQVTQDFYTFLVNFLKEFPEYKNRDFYLSGESYAGHYVPAMGRYILQKGGLKLNFKGVAIVDGLINFGDQGPAWATFAYDEKLINKTTFTNAYEGLKECIQALENSNYTTGGDQCLAEKSLILGNGTVPAWNPYDIRIQCDPRGPLCYDWSNIDAFLAQEKVKKLLGVQGKTFLECNINVLNALGNDFFEDYSDDLAFLVRSKLKVILSYGNKDWIANCIGGEKVVNSLDWNQRNKFSKLKLNNWKGLGEYKKQDNLTFLKVYNSGHFMPMDQPKAAFEMIEEFVKGWK